MISFTTPDGQTRVTIDGAVTTREPIADWRARTYAKLARRQPAAATKDLWMHIGCEVKHNHGTADVWAPLVSVSDSPYQGWDVQLTCCKLQSCFAESEYEVR